MVGLATRSTTLSYRSEEFPVGLQGGVIRPCFPTVNSPTRTRDRCLFISWKLHHSVAFCTRSICHTGW
ncbi:hypothetical protein EYF80_037574 [Liparis tanakae]|uniref:Uncharacterized protein n=1 Tax=Liparis tanakae TaxID=230148 RepID=A0A4Z2GFA9_9TELE|nr:hypothetical protein EYF80_037574 [Liparis tanakae]